MQPLYQIDEHWLSTSCLRSTIYVYWYFDMINICYNSVCVCPFDCSLQLNGTIIYNPKRSRVGWVYERVCVRECVVRVSALSRTLAPIYFASCDFHSLFDESFIHQSLASINRDVYPLSPDRSSSCIRRPTSW